jgi:hypothetical protein
MSTANGRSPRNGTSPATCAASRYSPLTSSNARRRATIPPGRDSITGRGLT